MSSRESVCVAISVATGLCWLRCLPFPEENALLQLVWLERPAVFYGVKYAYLAMLFTTPYIVCSILCSLAYIFLLRSANAPVAPKLPPYPDLASRQKLF